MITHLNATVPPPNDREGIDKIRKRITEKRFPLWLDFLTHLERTAEPDHTVVRFPNSSSYIFSTGSSCFWMVDPAFSYGDDDELTEELATLAGLMKEKISFILVTHLHADHCQAAWVKALAGTSVQWVVSSRFAGSFFQNLNGVPENTVVLRDDETIELSGIHITARSGYHCEPGKIPVISCAYDVVLPDGVKLFFPVDVRDPEAAVPDGDVNYTFGHVFLGREDATGSDFPHLESFSRFFAKRKTDHLILNHLYEIKRDAVDLWTHRHAEMIRETLARIAPEIQVSAPCYGDAIHLTKGSPVYPDLYQQWDSATQQDFLANLGISIKKDHVNQMEETIRRKIPVVEWTWHLLDHIPMKELQDQVTRWRAAGGKCLSIHFPDFPVRADDTIGIELFNRYAEITKAVKADRITIHVPGCILAETEEKLSGILDLDAELLMTLIQAGVKVGVENYHMKASTKADETRPIGYIPEELLLLVNGLRERCHSDLVGCHLDIGHAYSNYPFTEKYPLTEWFRQCGSLLNGLHLHQFEYAATNEKPYLVGHALISGRNTGHPNLHPLYDAWAKHQFHAPMILEICRDTEPYPFPSRERMEYLFGLE